mgnify:CR=1 FL=1
MNKYESIIIIGQDVTEEGIKALIARFTDLINSDGKIENVQEVGKKKLAYDVKKNKEGYYVIFTFEGKPECKLPIYFNISNILPEGQTKLNEQYRLYLKGTEKFTGVSDSYFNEFMAYPPFYVICNSDFGNKYDGRIYCSDTFGVYKSLEKVNNNGRIMIGGVYNRGSNYYQLEGFNYTTTVANGTQVIGWNFFMNAGDFGKVTGSLSITFIINELYLIKIPKNNN